jgi:hypothetical protein
MAEVVTTAQIVDEYTPDLPEYQRKANIIYIDKAWAILKMGGMWAYPSGDVIFKKVEGGWEMEDAIPA